MSRLLAPFFLLLSSSLSAFADNEEKAQAEEPAKEISKELSVEDLATKVRRSAVVITHGGRDGGEGGTGSGFVISKDGLIATCAHVIGQSRPLTVRFDDGSEHKVKSIHAWDATLDLAVLKIDAKGLEPVPLAKATSITQGAEVVAMGAPHGLEFSVVRGVVSAVRDYDGRALIQVAIPVEPGNSGGPLLDLEGRVHGLLTMKSAVTDNLGWAVPVGALHRLLEKPNPVPMEKWLTIGRLDPKRWKPIMGAIWKQRAGRISVTQQGKGFGGRSLCLSEREVPDVPYEVSVEVILDDEAGAAGLAFASDGEDRHYGFYPSGGGLRLTRFDGPDVFSWKILEQMKSDSYRPGDWNRLRVRVEEKKLTCFLNGEKVIELEDTGLRGGKVGLAKFRQTVATFRKFRLGANLAQDAASPELLARLERQIAKLKRRANRENAIAKLSDSPNQARALLRKEAERLRALADDLDVQSRAIHRRAISTKIAAALESKDEDKLLRAALLIARLDNPEIDVADYLEEVERMAGEIIGTLPKKATTEQTIEAVRTYLFKDNGFHGSRAEYYNRSNSYLNEVIDDREGIPITLSLLFIELAREAGAQLHGLGLPGHFVACYQDDKERRIIDPFEGGVEMSHEDANALILASGFGGTAAEMPVAEPVQIISRMLHNLQAIAIDEKEFADAISYVEILVSLNPDNPQNRLNRALLHLQLGKSELAKPDLEWILENKPEDINLARIRELLERL